MGAETTKSLAAKATMLFLVIAVMTLLRVKLAMILSTVELVLISLKVIAVMTFFTVEIIPTCSTVVAKTIDYMERMATIGWMVALVLMFSSSPKEMTSLKITQLLRIQRSALTL